MSNKRQDVSSGLQAASIKNRQLMIDKIEPVHSKYADSKENDRQQTIDNGEEEKDNEQRIMDNRQVDEENKKEPGKVDKKIMDAVVGVAWQVAKTALWNTSTFSQKEVMLAKGFISDLFLQEPDPYKAYEQFVQRVLLAKEYISNYIGRYIPLPSQWLDPQNEKGYAGTKMWFDNVQHTRSSLPLYRIELRAMAEAVMDMVEQPGRESYMYWRYYFTDKALDKMAGLFQVLVAELAFG